MTPEEIIAALTGPQGPKGDRGNSGPNLHVVTNRFEGDGVVTTTFTLTRSPAGVGYIIVAVAGVVLDTESYHLTGTQLAFNTAPTGLIEVRILSAAVESYAPGRNLVTNPDFRSWPDGALFSGSATHTANLWRLGVSGGSHAIERQPDGAGYVMQCSVSGQTADTHFQTNSHRIEGVKTLSGKAVSVSFDARVISGGGEIAVELVQVFGIGGSAFVGAIGVQKFALTSTFKRYAIENVVIPSIDGKVIGPGDCLQVTFWTSGGSAYSSRNGALGLKTQVVQIRDVQVEEGGVATPFERPSEEADQLRRLRYFWTSYYEPGELVFPSAGLTATSAQGQIQFPVPMRDRPVFSRSNASDFEKVGSSGTYSDISMPSATRFRAQMDCIQAGGVAGQAGIVRAVSAGAWVRFDARL